MEGIEANTQLKSGSVVAPDRTVRTVQQMAVLCMLHQREEHCRRRRPNVQDAQPHQKAQSDFSP